MRPEDSIRVGRIVRVLHEFVRPRRRGPSVPLEVAAFHVHGEPVTAAEAFAADYEPFAVGGAWGPAWDTTWFRLRGAVPPEWAGRQVALGFAIGGAGSTGFGAEALVWRDGRPVQGLSPNHREHLVATAALGGEAVEVFVEAAANPPSPFGTNPWPMLLAEPDGAPLFTLAQADLHVRDPEFEGFWHDFRVTVELLGELPEGEPRWARVCAGLERACNLLELPDISQSWRRAAPVLSELLAERPAPGTHAVAMIGHAHLDTAWLWPLRETVRKCARTFSTALDLMDRYPEYRFAVSQAQHLAWMRDRYPDLYERLKARIAEGRVEPTGSMWVEADCNIPSGESLVRQIVHGKRFYLDEFGIETSDVWLPDVFGYSAALPQIMRRAGIRWFLTQKLSWNQYNVLPHHSFFWEGIDGSRVFTHFPPADTYNGNVSVRELRFAVENFKDHDRASRSLYLFGWGDGGGGPTAEMLESARRLAETDGVPRLSIEGPRAFFSQAEAEAEAADAPVWAGELYLELHRGTYTSQAATKLGNRRGEFALREAELWAALRDRVRLPGRRPRRAVEGAPLAPVPRHHSRARASTGSTRTPPATTPRSSPRRTSWPSGPWASWPVPPTPRTPATRWWSSTPCRTPAASWSPSRPPRRSPRPPIPPGAPARSSATPRAGPCSKRRCPPCGFAVYDLGPGERSDPAPGDRRAPHPRERAPPGRPRRPWLVVLGARQGRRARGAGRGRTGEPLPAPPRLPELLRRLGHRPVQLRPGGGPRRGRRHRGGRGRARSGPACG